MATPETKTLSDEQSALGAYRKFLEMDPQSPSREAVEERIAEMQKALEETKEKK